MPVVHFVNLVGWMEITALPEQNSDIFYCDSLSLKAMILLVTGRNVRRNSGFKYVEELPSENVAVSYLLSFGTPSENRFILPQFGENDLRIDRELESFIVGTNSRIVCIGISSPKQNILAIELSKIRSDLTYICLGAALYQSRRYPKIIDKLGLNWLLLLMTRPSRTFRKLMSTTFACVQIFMLRNHRRKLHILSDLLASQKNR